jgi:hypothetical protein
MSDYGAILIPMHATSDRAAKGRRKMRGLRDDIQTFWEKSANVTGRPVSGGYLEIESLDDVGNALDHAPVSIRTIDADVLKASDPANYTTLLTSDPGGASAKALVAPRNSAVHHHPVWHRRPRSAAPAQTSAALQHRQPGTDRTAPQGD